MIRSWADLEFWRSKHWEEITRALDILDEANTIYWPQRRKIFNALRLTPFRKVQCVILGQDPYHDGSATGLAFSSDKAFKDCPASLRNIYAEYQTDTGYPAPSTGNLAPWAKRGVLLLNTSLTVLDGTPLSHAHLGWQHLIDEILFEVSHTDTGVVFVLWGGRAEEMAKVQIGRSPRVFSRHPSPFSAHKGFFGSRPFTKVNALLTNGGKPPIDWRLP